MILFADHYGCLFIFLVKHVGNILTSLKIWSKNFYIMRIMKFKIITHIHFAMGIKMNMPFRKCTFLSICIHQEK